MFEITNILRDVDMAVNYLEMADLISLLAVEDSDFNNRINSFGSDIKNKIENAALYLYHKENKDINEIKFLNKYNKNILESINSDIKNVLNSKYCFNILSQESSKCNNDEDIIKIFNMSLKNLFNKLDEELERISNKLLNGIELSSDEKQFYENYILFTVTNQIIYDEDNAEILKYFNKYPITDIESPKNRQLYLIFMVLNNVSLLGKTICLAFNDDINVNNNKIVTFGRIGKLPDGRSIIEINNTDLYNIKNDYEFYWLIFVLLHELGHFNQDINYDKYSDFEKNRMDMENKLRNVEPDFYSKYHNNFFIEQDADMYAVKRLLKEFDSISDALNICNKKVLQLEKVYNEDSDFYNLELEKYHEYMNNNSAPVVK